MASISTAAEAARETARTTTGQFGAQEHSAPDFMVGQPLTVAFAGQVQLHGIGVVPYPAVLPEGGVVDLDEDDNSGTVFASLSFPDGEYFSLGIDSYGDEWDNSDSDDRAFVNGKINEAIYDYLRAVQQNAETAASYVRSNAFSRVKNDIKARVLGEPVDLSDEATHRRVVARGKSLVEAASDEEDIDYRTADAIADVLVYARENGVDIEELIARAQRFADED